MKAKLFVIIAMLALLVACKTVELNVVKESTVEGVSYSYVDIDPVVIGKTWEEVAKNPLNAFTVEIYYRNSDTTHPIQFATLVVTPSGIGAYSYMIDGEINVFGFDVEKNAYESIWDTLSEESKALWHQDYEGYFGLTMS